MPTTFANETDGTWLMADWDGDGLSNHDEFLLGTDPKDSSSGLLIQLEMAGQRVANIHFPYLSNRSYRINASDDLLTWADTAVEELRFDSNGFAVWSDTDTPTMGKRFYRLVVR